MPSFRFGLPCAVAASLLVAAAPWPVAAQGAPAETPDAVCRAVEAYAADAMRTLPIRIDAATELVGVTVDCATGVVTYIKQLLVPANQIAPAAEDRKQLEHTALHCGIDGLASVFAMTVVDEVRAPDGAIFATLTTAPSDCDRLTPALAAAAALLTAEELEARLAAIAAVYQPNLPVRLSDSLSLMSVFQGADALVFFYKLGAAYPPEAGPAVEAQMRPALLDNDCTDDDRLILLRSGATVTYRFRDANDTNLFAVTVTAAECTG
ncbi:MAG: hypothetical protein KIS68_06280 [Bauldia sp.]|nr:hypothetical protein [Bauldia sp.]